MGVLFKDELKRVLTEMVEEKVWYKQMSKKIEALGLIESKREKLGEDVTKDLKNKIEALYEMNENTTGGK